MGDVVAVGAGKLVVVGAIDPGDHFVVSAAGLPLPSRTAAQPLDVKVVVVLVVPLVGVAPPEATHSVAVDFTETFSFEDVAVAFRGGLNLNDPLILLHTTVPGWATFLAQAGPTPTAPTIRTVLRGKSRAPALRMNLRDFGTWSPFDQQRMNKSTASAPPTLGAALALPGDPGASVSSLGHGHDPGRDGRLAVPRESEAEGPPVTAHGGRYRPR
jgi:hypothetical protein